MLISHRCIRGLMRNLIKKSWTVSNLQSLAHSQINRALAWFHLSTFNCSITQQWIVNCNSHEVAFNRDIYLWKLKKCIIVRMTVTRENANKWIRQTLHSNSLWYHSYFREIRIKLGDFVFLTEVDKVTYQCIEYIVFIHQVS